ncbi:MAG: hypothetical protein ACI4QB_09700, partial [Eubacteriales bacterium]
CQELVSNTATAMTALFNDKGRWPKALLSNGGAKEGKLDENAAYPLATGGYMTLSYADGKLTGYDKFGIVSPWALKTLKSRGTSAARSDRVSGAGGTIDDHVLRYALDVDGDGIIEGATVGGESINVRATCIVWCCGKDGKIEAYSEGLRRDDVYSWHKGQTEEVK